jgi:hypothetical protein
MSVRTSSVVLILQQGRSMNEETPSEGGRKLSKMTLAQAEKESPIDVKAAAGMFSPRPSAKTMYQWRTIGLKRGHGGKSVRLQWFRMGGTLMTTVEAVGRFKSGANEE